jgi:hypothetical protein
MSTRRLARMELSEAQVRRLEQRGIRTAEDFFKRHTLELIDTVIATKQSKAYDDSDGIVM